MMGIPTPTPTDAVEGLGTLWSKVLNDYPLLSTLEGYSVPKINHYIEYVKCIDAAKKVN
jgi:hypothetical protein